MLLGTRYLLLGMKLYLFDFFDLFLLSLRFVCFVPYVPLRSPLVPCAPLRSGVVIFTSVGFLQVVEL